MSPSNSLKKYNINKEQIILLFPILILMGKFVRFTLMKTLLVDTSIGWELLPRILNDNLTFAIGGIEENVYGNAKDNTIIFYKLLNVFLQTESFYVFEIAVTVIYNILILFVFRRFERKVPLFQAVFLMVFVIVLNLFDFTLAKEPIQMLFFLVIFCILISERIPDTIKFILCMSVLLLCALTFRIYFMFIMYFSIVIYGLLKWGKVGEIRSKRRMTLIIIISLSLSILLLVYVLRYVSAEDYAYLMRIRTKENRLGSTSQINVLFRQSATNPVFYVLDILILIVRMLFPVELARLGWKYIPYIVFQLMITYFYFKSLISIKDTKNQKLLLSLCIFTGFLVGSATFEPDFGSWVRHEATLFPVIMFFSNMIPSFSIKEKNKSEAADV